VIFSENMNFKQKEDDLLRILKTTDEEASIADGKSHPELKE
jgi:hypothetical protein